MQINMTGAEACEKCSKKTGCTSPPAVLFCVHMRQFRGLQRIIYCRSMCVCVYLLMVHNLEIT